MISIDYGIHLTSKSNGSHGHWTTAARIAKRERTKVLDLVDAAMLRLSSPNALEFRGSQGWAPRPFELRKVTYTGRYRGIKAQKTKMVRVLSPEWAARLDGGLTVTLTRYAEKFLDDDGLRRGFKHIRDGVADAFGIADNDPRLKFEYNQVAQPPSRINVRIEWKLPTT